MNPSPEIKQLIEKLAPKKKISSSQDKYEAILARKSYDHHCFLQCVCLRLDPSRDAEGTHVVQTTADDVFTQMLTHAM
jgi:hypothetical protein